MALTGSASATSNALFWNLEAPALYEQVARPPRGPADPRAARSWPTPASTPAARRKDKFVVRDATTEDEVWWDNNAAITPEQFDAPAGRLPRATPRARSCSPRTSTAAPIRPTGCGRGSSPNSPGTRSSSATCCIRPERDELAGFAPDLTIIDLPSLQGRSGPPRLPHRDGHRLRLHAAGSCSSAARPMPAR